MKIVLCGRTLILSSMLKIKFLFTLLCVLVVTNLDAQRKVVFIIVDGIPADVIETVPTPVLDEISQAGGYTRAYLGGEKGGYSQSPTISAVGYNHVLTGTWSNKHNVWGNAIQEPNYHYWNIFRIAKTVRPETKTAIFSSWTDNRTKLVGESLEAAGNLKLDYAFDGLESDKVKFPHTADKTHMLNIDEAVASEAARYIEANGPDLSWVYLEFPDDMGHMHGDSPQLIDAVKKADAQLGRIWKAVQERMKKHREEWMVIVTTDHGRDGTTGKNHGGQSDRERTTWIATNVKTLNAHFKEIPAAVDIVPSIANFMNLVVPEAVRNELDGTPFIGPVSVSQLKATREGNTVTLKWNVLNGKGKAEIKLATSNHFQKGGADNYQSVGTVNVADGTFTFSLPQSETGFYKLLLIAPDNTLNTWIVPGK